VAELAIVGGLMVDGAGSPGRPGTVLVDRGRLRLLAADAPLPSHGRQIDASGLVVAPGFIDLHSHSGLWLLAHPDHEPKVRQGITTEVIGVDGLSYAPIRNARDLDWQLLMNAGLDGNPPLDHDWDTVASYLGRFDGQVAVNIAFLIGNSALRMAAVGWDERPASTAELADMRSMLAEGMAEGAFGLSSGLDYPPGSYASTEELAGLLAEAAAHGGFYHTHVRYLLGDRFLDPFREALDIGGRAPGPVHLTHFYHRPTYPGGPELMLDLVEDARARGRDVTFDAYPYEWASTRLLIQLPGWVQSGGPLPLRERLTDAGVRARLRPEVTSATNWTDVRLGAFTAPENASCEGRTVAEIMAERGTDAVDTICDLLLTENLAVNQVTGGPDPATLHRFVSHPLGLVGTDSTFVGDRPSPRTYGSFPRILGQFVRDEARLTLEEAIRKMTSAAAQRLGLRERGLLADGHAADVVVFDPARVRSNATYEQPRRYPDGIEYVIVNGRLAVDRGHVTGVRAGRALRHRRD
jgi:N-acyl-D-amino-acid deacylase